MSKSTKKALASNLLLVTAKSVIFFSKEFSFSVNFNVVCVASEVTCGETSTVGLDWALEEPILRVLDKYVVKGVVSTTVMTVPAIALNPTPKISSLSTTNTEVVMGLGGRRLGRGRLLAIVELAERREDLILDGRLLGVIGRDMRI